MTTAVQIRTWTGASRRRVQRFRMQAPLDVTVLRSGVPDTVPGRSLNVCERGIAAVIAGELVPGESVGVEVQLPLVPEPLRTRATVKYQDRLRCGLEFVALSVEQRASIRDWAREAKAETEGSMGPAVVNKSDKKESKTNKEGDSSAAAQSTGKPGRKLRGILWLLIVVLMLGTAAGIFWWKWNRAWEELESGLKTSENLPAEKPQVQVPAEVMQKLLVHRVEPIYPVAARKEKLQGIIAVDIVVGKDGSVHSMHALNGPDVLAKAAIDALRWWKFEPYRVNGEPAVVETTVAVEFKR